MSKLCMGGIGSSYHNHNQIFDKHAGAGASSTSVGSLPGNWLAARIADLTPDLQMLFSLGSTVMSFNSRQSFSVKFFHVSLGLPPPPPPPAINLYITCCSDCTTRKLHMPKPGKPLSKWGWGPQALPLAGLTSRRPHPLAWYCRSVWSWPYHCTAGSSWSVAKFHWHGAQHASDIYIATGLVREVVGCENW